LGLEIKCATEQWQYLIKHEEMIGQQGVVKAILMSPDFINQSAKKKNCHTYYKRLVLAKIGSTYVRVVVEIKYRLSPKSWKYGNLINAFSCNGEQLGEVRIWTKK